MNNETGTMLMRYDVPESIGTLDEADLVRQEKRYDRAGSTASYLGGGSLGLLLYDAFVGIVRGTTATTYDVILLLLAVILIALAFYLGSKETKVHKLRRNVFRKVRQGRIIKRTTRGGGKTCLQWVVELEGYNRRNEIRTYVQKVDAGGWFDGTYEVGKYVDFRKDKSVTG